MPRHNSWPAKPTVYFETVRDSEFTETLAELGGLIYDHFCSRQLQNPNDQSIATSSHEVASENPRKERCA